MRIAGGHDSRFTQKASCSTARAARKVGSEVLHVSSGPPEWILGVGRERISSFTLSSFFPSFVCAFPVLDPRHH